MPHFWRAGRRISGKVPIAVKARRYRVPGCETFAGYYEIQPISKDNRALLAHASPVARRALTAQDEAQLGFFDLESGAFTQVATTTLWCWQMGARLRWWDQVGDRALLFNAVHEGTPSACVASPGSARQALCNVPLFDVSRDGRIGLSLNFGRLARCRPGYGYLAMADPFADQSLPDGDGVTLVELDSGKAHLAYSMPQFARCVEGAGPQQYHYLNAASLSPAGQRFSVLYKRLARPENPHQWSVDAMIGECDGSGLRHVALPGRASHYWWLDDQRIVYTVAAERGATYLLFDCASGKLTPLSNAAPGIDGHPSQIAPDAPWITDQYPDLYGEQALFLFDQNDDQLTEIARFAADGRYQDEWRCDLHPRWSRDGRAIYVDSTHEGYRAIYRVEVAGS